MGIIQSLICAAILCFERVISWTCCALVIVTLLGMIVLFTFYGISLGHNYAQKELAKFAQENSRRMGPEEAANVLNEPVVRLVAVNKTQAEPMTDASGQIYQSEVTQTVFLASSATPIIFLESERPKQEVDLTPHERELARKLIGRFRRARRNKSTSQKIISPSDQATKPSPKLAVIVEA